MRPNRIPQQAQLPLRMAASVVAQGIKIRLGRSLVTITGIVLGIAFLVSILGSQALRRGVAEEDRLREAASRMYGYLVAETGALGRRSVAVIVTAPPSPIEQRFLQRLSREQLGELRVWHRGGHAAGAFAGSNPRRVSDPAKLAEGAACLLILGSGPVPDVSLATVVEHMTQPVIGVTSGSRQTRVASPVALLRLQRELPADERARIERKLQREHFRGVWIIVISLLVTVIGITNAMLMSVTERFRDIGTMKCLGATSRFIRQIFLLEASFMGLVGGLAGVVLGLLVSIGTYVVLYDVGLVMRTVGSAFGALAIAAGEALIAAVVLSVVAALYPARFASRMVPADALRSNV